MAEQKRGPRRGDPQARNGGKAVSAKYGVEFFREIGRKGGQTIKERGTEYLSRIGKQGGNTTKARHGVQHFVEIGRKGGQNGKGRAKFRVSRSRMASALT